MTHESEQNAAFEAFAEAAASPLSSSQEKPAAGRYAPGSAQERLAKMSPDELKKAYRDARFLVDMRNFFGMTIVFSFPVAGVQTLNLFFFLIQENAFPLFAVLLFGPLFGLSGVCLLVTFFAFRFSFAKQIIRIAAIEAAVFAAVILIHVISGWFYTAPDGGLRFLTPARIIETDMYGSILRFSLGVFGLIFAPLTCLATFNPNLFGPGRFTYAQIKYVWEKRNAGQEPDRIPPPAFHRAPGLIEKLITYIAAFGLVYLPLCFAWFVVAVNKGWLD
ncbi:MAG: hypothetical protein J6W70_09415 [Lentisphaeria bacterium]|nr:hypothetical protein [Lentisphaeria bacterium]